MIIDENLKKHDCFKLLDECIKFYDHLSFSTLGFLVPGVNFGPGIIFNLDSDIFLSISCTMKSIKQILLSGQINDAYTLVRKYNDLVIINTYEIIILKTERNMENFIVEKIDRWFKGQEKLPIFKRMNKKIQKSKELESINRIINRDDRYKKIRDRCNDHTHYNYFQYMQLNSEMHVPRAELFLQMIENDVLDLVILHFAYLFTLNGHYMSSSDYIDCLDLNIKPEEGSQYWVAPFIQEFFDKFIKTRSSDIAIQMINDTYMDLN